MSQSTSHITAVYGSANAKGGSGKMYAFLCPNELVSVNDEQHLSSQATKQESLELLSKNFYPSLENIRKEIGGTTTDIQLMVADGVLLKVFATYRGGRLSQKVTGVVYLRVRSDGPQWLIRPRGGLPQQWKIMGRFDILPKDEVTALRVKRVEKIDWMMDSHEVKSMFDITKLSEEIRRMPRKSIKEVDGVTVIRKKVSRKIRV